MCAILVIAADAYIKRIGTGQTFMQSVGDRRMFIVCFLYLIQVWFATYTFLTGELAIWANMFIVFYGVLAVVVGAIMFGETLSVVQYTGIALGLIGAILMNL